MIRLSMVVVLLALFGGCGGDQVNACEKAGGQCKGVGDCGAGVGFLGNEDCGGGSGITCCYASCGGESETNFKCCMGTASFRPICKSGHLECLPGHTRC